ncbi:MAG: hypothetical protein JW932_17765 [Deltaproteobacteria bacterium]|nr:hypothetical protein [Deltaproteobacteria bacterium]
MIRRWVFIFLISIMLVIAGWACGRKAPPFIPEAVFSAKVVGLEGQWVEGKIVLTGTIDLSETQEDIHGEIKGCRVYLAEFPVENSPCKGCPIQYSHFHECGANVIGSNGFVCDMPIDDRDRILFLKVHLIGPNGILGPASEQIRVEVE